MSTTLVPPRPYHIELATFDVDKSIAARHTSQLISNVSYLFGKNVEHIVESIPNPVQLVQRATSSPANASTAYQWFYQRSPDVKFVQIGYECYKTTQGWDTQAFDQIVSASLPSGAFFISETDNLEFSGLLCPDQRTWSTDYISHVGICNVSALPTGSLSLFTLNVTASNATASFGYLEGGLSKIWMQEVPMLTMNVSSTDQTGSIDDLWSTPFNRLIDGSATTEKGYARILDQTKLARRATRNHWQILNHQGSGYAGLLGDTRWSFLSTSTGPVTFGIANEGLFDNEWDIRTRNYDGITTSEVNKYTFAVRYKTLNGTDSCQLNLNWTTEPNGFTGTETLNLPATTVWSTVTGSVEFRCDQWAFQREALVSINFTGNVSVGGQECYLSTLSLIENES